MTKRFIADIIQEHAEISGPHAYRTAQAVLDGFVNQLRLNRRFTVSGLGRWTVCKLPARKATNPKTGERIKVKASKTVRFHASPKLRKKV